MPETGGPPISRSEQQAHSQLELPRRERRAMTRQGDNEAFAIAEAAIFITKNEIDPNAFEKSKESFKRFLRVAKRQALEKRLTEQQYDDKLAEFHAATNVADSFDVLTDAFDRVTIKRMVERGIQSKPDEGKTHIYLDLDINKLKAMNEKSRNGHDSADAALAGFSRFHMGALSTKFGQRAKFGRLSGDEFAIFIQNTLPEEVDEFFEEIEPARREAMGRIVDKEELPNDITAMRAMTTLQPGDTFESMHARTDSDLLAQKAERNLQQVKTTEN